MSMRFIGFCRALVLGFLCGCAAVPRNGAVWYDRAGHVLNAHGGCVLLHGGRYYLFGEHKVYGTTGNFAHVGVHAYSSDDLSEWTDEGLALAVGGKGGLPDGCVIERPKVIFCATTGKFVMYFHWERDAHYNEAMVGIAQADSPAGPYVLMRTVRPTPSTYPINARDEDRGAAALAKSESEWKVPCNRSPEGERALIYPAHVAQGQESRDMTLFVDRNKTAYLIHSSERNSTLHVVELSDDYVGFTGRWWRIAEKDWTEAPAVCEKDGWYYLIGSDCTGWVPNVARAYRARAIIGPWERLGNPCRGINPANGRGPELTWGDSRISSLRRRTDVIWRCSISGIRRTSWIRVWSGFPSASNPGSRSSNGRIVTNEGVSC